MKKYQCSIFIAFITLAILSSCRSVNINNQVQQERNELDQKEQWRYKLPISETAPIRPFFPKIKKAVLKNGLTILVVEDHRLPIAQVGLVIKNGSAKDPISMAGLNYLTALMLKEGTKQKTGLELAESFANLGTEVSIAVGKDMTQISSAILSDKVSEIVALMASMVKEPRMELADFTRIKKLHESQLAAYQGVASYVAQVHFLMAAYGPKHPYAYPNSGLLKTIAKIELSDVKRAHEQNYGGEVAGLVVVGDVSLKQIKKLAKKQFGTWKKTAEHAKKIADPVVHKEMQTELVAKANSPQTYIIVGQPAVKQNDPDLPALEILQSIIAGYPTSRLEKNLRENRGWTYGLASQLTPLLGKGPMMLSTSIQMPYGADAINEILLEFAQLQKNPVSEQELSVAKNGLLHSFDQRYSTVGKTANLVATQFTYSLPENSDEILYDNIAKVTQKDILRVANRVLKKDHMIAVAVGDLEALEASMPKMNFGKISVER